MKCDVLFSQGSVRTLFRRGGYFFIHEQKMSSSLHSAKIIKIDRDFPKLWSQMCCHLFYGSQCSLQCRRRLSDVADISVKWYFVVCELGSYCFTFVYFVLLVSVASLLFPV